MTKPLTPIEKRDLAERLYEQSRQENLGEKAGAKTMTFRVSGSQFLLFRMMFGYGSEFAGNVRQALMAAARRKVERLKRS